MSGPEALSLTEIRNYMLENGCMVTNHALVKHFKRFLTHSETQNEARKQFKTYVNILATIKTENNQKFLILRKKYIKECPSEDVVQRALATATSVTSSNGSGSVPSSPSCAADISVISEGTLSSPAPFRQPPPYKPPPEVIKPVTGITVNQENSLNYRDCVKEFAAVIQRIDPARAARQGSSEDDGAVAETAHTPIKSSSKMEQRDNREEENQRRDNKDFKESQSDGKESKKDNKSAAKNKDKSNKENLPRLSISSQVSSSVSEASSSGEAGSISAGSQTAMSDAPDGGGAGSEENPMSVKEATRKFNRMASVEEAKILSPPNKKKPEKNVVEEKIVPDVTMAHPKAKEWIVSMSRASHQELAKLAQEYPELVKLQDPATTALHWAAKHGDEDVVKLIAGTYKANVNAPSNGGYTPLHLAMQFGRVNIFELLCNVYKADRDVMDWSGKKPLEYRMQRTTVSASTYSKIKAKRKHTEKDLGFLRIGSLNVRVKKTTEAFSNFLGVGNGNGHGHSMGPPTQRATVNGPMTLPHHHQRYPRHHHQHHLHQPGGTMRTHPHHYHPTTNKPRPSSEIPTGSSNSTSTLPHHGHALPMSRSKFDKLHKSWGSADNIQPQPASSESVAKGLMMPPPQSKDSVKKRPKSGGASSKRSSVTDSPRDSISSSNSSTTVISGYSSMPSTPNQLRAPHMGGGGGQRDIGDSDSDSAYGFGSNWSVNGRSSLSGPK